MHCFSLHSLGRCHPPQSITVTLEPNFLSTTSGFPYTLLGAILSPSEYIMHFPLFSVLVTEQNRRLVPQPQAHAGRRDIIVKHRFIMPFLGGTCCHLQYTCRALRKV